MISARSRYCGFYIFVRGCNDFLPWLTIGPAPSVVCRIRYHVWSNWLAAMLEKLEIFRSMLAKLTEMSYFFFQISSKPSLIPVKFFGKWNRFVKMVNAILWRNLPALKRSYHLPKAWTDRFAHVNDKQPRFGTMGRQKKLYVRSMVQRNSGFPALVHTSQSRMRKKILMSLSHISWV